MNKNNKISIINKSNDLELDSKEWHILEDIRSTINNEGFTTLGSMMNIYDTDIGYYDLDILYNLQEIGYIELL